MDSRKFSQTYATGSKVLRRKDSIKVTPGKMDSSTTDSVGKIPLIGDSSATDSVGDQ